MTVVIIILTLSSLVVDWVLMVGRVFDKDSLIMTSGTSSSR